MYTLLYLQPHIAMIWCVTYRQLLKYLPYVNWIEYFHHQLLVLCARHRAAASHNFPRISQGVWRASRCWQIWCKFTSSRLLCNIWVNTNSHSTPPTQHVSAMCPDWDNCDDVRAVYRGSSSSAIIIAKPRRGNASTVAKEIADACKCASTMQYRWAKYPKDDAPCTHTHTRANVHTPRDSHIYIHTRVKHKRYRSRMRNNHISYTFIDGCA